MSDRAKIALAGPAVDIANQTVQKSAYVKNKKSGELKIEYCLV